MTGPLTPFSKRMAPIGERRLILINLLAAVPRLLALHRANKVGRSDTVFARLNCAIHLIPFRNGVCVVDPLMA